MDEYKNRKDWNTLATKYRPTSERDKEIGLDYTKPEWLKERVQEYIEDKSLFHEDKIVCPYCGYNEYENETLYMERDEEEFVCDNCLRTFKLTAHYDWWFDCDPIEEKIVKEDCDE